MTTVKNVYTVSFFGHRNIENIVYIENKLKIIIKKLILEKSYVEFLVGRNGEFDKLVASCVRNIKNTCRNDNSALILVLPYPTAEYRNNIKNFEAYFDEIEICDESATAHFKSAIQIRNRYMINRSDLIICYTDRNHGGAYNSVNYAVRKEKEIINIADLT